MFYLESVEASQVATSSSAVEHGIARRRNTAVALVALEELEAIRSHLRAGRVVISGRHTCSRRGFRPVFIIIIMTTTTTTSSRTGSNRTESVDGNEFEADDEAQRTQGRAGRQLLTDGEARTAREVALAILPAAWFVGCRRVGVDQSVRTDPGLECCRSALTRHDFLPVAQRQTIAVLDPVQPVGQERDPNTLIFASSEFVKAAAIRR